MPDIRTYASEDNARKALEREGLLLDTVKIIPAPDDATRFTPLFDIDRSAPGAAELIARCEAEGFLYAAGVDPNAGGANGDHSNAEPASGEPNPGDQPGENEPAPSAGDGTPEPRGRRSYLNPHVSDLFFNYSHDDFVLLGSMDPAPDDFDERRMAALNKDAREFADGVRYAFGVVLDTEELVVDFLERL